MEKEIQVLNGLASGPASTAGKTTVTRTLPDDLADKVSEWLELSEQSSLLDKQKKALDEKRKSASLPLIEALGPDMDTGLITINDETYEVKNSPRKGTEIKRDVLDLLIDRSTEQTPIWRKSSATVSWTSRVKRGRSALRRAR